MTGALEGVLCCGGICGGSVLGSRLVGCVLERGLIQLGRLRFWERVIEQLGSLGLVEVLVGFFSRTYLFWRPPHLAGFQQSSRWCVLSGRFRCQSTCWSCSRLPRLEICSDGRAVVMCLPWVLLSGKKPGHGDILDVLALLWPGSV